MNKKKVLIVDDSKTVREALAEIIDSFEGFEVIGKAADPYEARDLMKKRMPDIITLDVEMPKMDGLTFLDKIMRGFPLPVVMISSLTKENAAITLKALELGAVDYILKPDSGKSLSEIAPKILEKLTIAVQVSKSWLSMHKFRKKDVTLTEFAKHTIKMVPLKGQKNMDSESALIVIGASTGGTVVIENILSGLNHTKMPPIFIVQHIPPFFSKTFADRLDKILPFNVFEAQNGLLVHSGDVIIAQGGKHLLVEKTKNGYSVIVKEGPRVNRHRPSVDVLFKSAASVAEENTVGVLLTGMGSDGASGMEDLKKKGGVTIVQEREECAVSGMPRSAIERGVVDKELDTKRIVDFINSIFMVDYL
jgi:two-component system, chemotaxis family, protein-glutamate methylesterase/glutaminase